MLTASAVANRGDFGDLHIATSLISRRFNGFSISGGAAQKTGRGQAHRAERRALEKILAGNVTHLILPFSQNQIKMGRALPPSLRAAKL